MAAYQPGVVMDDGPRSAKTVARYARNRLPFSFTTTDLTEYLARTDEEAKTLDVAPWLKEAIKKGDVVERDPGHFVARPER